MVELAAVEAGPGLARREEATRRGCLATVPRRKRVQSGDHGRDAPGIGKNGLIYKGATPKMEIDAETYPVTADGELLVYEPADKLPMAQRYLLFV